MVTEEVLVAEFPPNRELRGIKIWPALKEATAGTSIPLRLFGRYSEGPETLVRLTRAEPIEYQIEPPEAGELDAFHRLQVKRPGPFRIVARHRGFEDSADLTALGDVRPPDIAWTGSTPNGLAVLRVTGSEGRTHLLEESGDLANWSSVLTNRMPPSGHFFHTNGAASPRASFYRARLLVE